jgi:hypothetical protein
MTIQSEKDPKEKVFFKIKIDLSNLSCFQLKPKLNNQEPSIISLGMTIQSEKDPKEKVFFKIKIDLFNFTSFITFLAKTKTE